MAVAWARKRVSNHASSRSGTDAPQTSTDYLPELCPRQRGSCTRGAPHSRPRTDRATEHRVRRRRAASRRVVAWAVRTVRRSADMAARRTAGTAARRRGICPDLGRHQDPQDRVDQDLAARDDHQDQDEEEACRPRVEAESAPQPGAHGAKHPPLARPDKSLLPEGRVDVGHDSVCFLEVNDLGTPTVLLGPPRAHQGRTPTGPGESPERRSGGRRCRPNARVDRPAGAAVRTRAPRWVVVAVCLVLAGATAGAIGLTLRADADRTAAPRAGASATGSPSTTQSSTLSLI